MRWWTFGIYASIAWALAVVVISVCMMSYISAHPMGPKLDEAREEKAGNMAGLRGAIPTVTNIVWVALAEAI